MAIKKEKTIKSGYIAEYWRVGIITYNRLEGTVYLRVDAYKDQAKRVEDLGGIAESISYNFPIGEVNENSSLMNVYEYIKGLPEFDGAIDI